MDELKPCPFCGGCVEIISNGEHSWVCCKNGDCPAGEGAYKTEEEAAKAWNQRIK